MKIYGREPKRIRPNKQLSHAGIKKVMIKTEAHLHATKFIVLGDLPLDMRIMPNIFVLIQDVTFSMKVFS